MIRFYRNLWSFFFSCGDQDAISVSGCDLSWDLKWTLWFLFDKSRRPAIEEIRIETNVNKL